jgi:hypothetical protein
LAGEADIVPASPMPGLLKSRFAQFASPNNPYTADPVAWNTAKALFDTSGAARRSSRST